VAAPVAAPVVVVGRAPVAVLGRVPFPATGRVPALALDRVPAPLGRRPACLEECLRDMAVSCSAAPGRPAATSAQSLAAAPGRPAICHRFQYI
jgi:hypothetical protein